MDPLTALGVIAAVLTIAGSALTGALWVGRRVIRRRGAIDPPPVKAAEQRVLALAAGVQIDYFAARLGRAAIKSSRPGGSEAYTYVDPFYYVHAIVDPDGRILFYSVTTRSPQFHPTFRINEGGHPTLTVTLGQDSFDRVVPEPNSEEYAMFVGARRFGYYETHYLGNPGLYQTYVLALNDAGHFDTLGELISLAKARGEILPMDRRSADEVLEAWERFRRSAKVNTFGVVSAFVDPKLLGSDLYGPSQDLVRVVPIPLSEPREE